MGKCIVQEALYASFPHKSAEPAPDSPSDVGFIIGLVPVRHCHAHFDRQYSRRNPIAVFAHGAQHHAAHLSKRQKLHRFVRDNRGDVGGLDLDIVQLEGHIECLELPL